MSHNGRFVSQIPIEMRKEISLQAPQNVLRCNKVSFSDSTFEAMNQDLKINILAHINELCGEFVRIIYLPDWYVRNLT